MQYGHSAQQEGHCPHPLRATVIQEILTLSKQRKSDEFCERKAHYQGTSLNLGDLGEKAVSHKYKFLDS